jgi:hypothetical protein
MRRRARLGRLLRAPAFQRAPDLKEFPDLAGFNLDQFIDRFIALFRRVRYDKAAGAVPYFDEPDQFGALNRLAVGLRAGVEHRHEIALSWQPAANRKTAGTDEARNLIEHMIGIAAALG